jgi:hypothetical protein
VYPDHRIPMDVFWSQHIKPMRRAQPKPTG